MIRFSCEATCITKSATDLPRRRSCCCSSCVALLSHDVSRSNRVILIGIRTNCHDISRWLYCSSWLCDMRRTRISPTLGDPRENDHQLNLQQWFEQNAIKSTYTVVGYREYIKAPKDKYLPVFLHSAPGTCKAGYRIEIHAKAREKQ
jgi:hypothetical protein